MERVLTAEPAASGMVLDLPSTAAKARARMRAAGLEDRCAVRGGDFFSAIPEDGDLYILRDILHDWADERCVELLNVCRRSMPPDASVLVVERVTGQRAEDAILHGLLDLYMLAAVGGRERSLRAWEQLMARAGFRLTERHRLGGGAMAFLLAPVAD